MEKSLVVENLNVKIGNKAILNNISFSCNKGHIVGLIGPNGAGKTTIMKSILGLIPYSESHIMLNGIDVKKQTHLGIGALIENPSLYPFLTGFQHLNMYATDKGSILPVVEELGMQSYIHKLAKGYSLGMKQKLGIAISLIDNPSLLILDEPMNGLDPKSTRTLRNLLRKLSKEGTTILISSHILPELEKIIDDVLIIDHGKILLNASKKEIEDKLPNNFEITTSNNAAIIKKLHQNNFNIVSITPTVELYDVQSSKITELLKIITSDGIQVLSFQSKKKDLENQLLEIIEKRND